MVTKVVSTTVVSDMYTLYVRSKMATSTQLRQAVPPSNTSFALTVAGGDKYAGLQSGEMYVYWRRYNTDLLIAQISMRATGDPEPLLVNRLFTDSIILNVPIVTIGPGGPVIDLDYLLVGGYKIFRPQFRNRN